MIILLNYDLLVRQENVEYKYASGVGCFQGMCHFAWADQREKQGYI